MGGAHDRHRRHHPPPSHLVAHAPRRDPSPRWGDCPKGDPCHANESVGRVPRNQLPTLDHRGQTPTPHLQPPFSTLDFAPCVLLHSSSDPHPPPSRVLVWGYARPVEYQALYRTHRPQRFGDVVGQGHVTTTLRREVIDGKVAHAYLFAGPRGTGKTTTARILAKALNCPNRADDGEPCDACDSCRAVTDGISFDVIELDAASHNSVDDVRDLTMSVNTVASVGGGRRVFILDEAHMLSKAAANALLKTLEEPPSHVHFVLATTEPYRLLDTIRSRTQRFDFHPISLDSLVDHLESLSGGEGFTVDRDSLVAVARHARGSARDALSLLEQVAALGAGTVDLAGVRRALGLADAEQFPRLAKAIENGDAGDVLALLSDLDATGVDLRRFVTDAIAFFRGVFLAGWSDNLDDLVDEPGEVLADWRAAADELAAGTVLRTIDVLGDGLSKIREGREERLMVELSLLKLVRPELDVDTAALRDRIEKLERVVNRLTDTPRPASQAAAPRPQPEPPADPSAPFEAPQPASSASGPTSPVTTRPGLQTPPGPPDQRPATPPAASGPAPVAAPFTTTLEELEKAWPQIFGALRAGLGPRRQALFREAVPGAVHDGVLELWVPGHLSFHLEQLRSDEEVKDLVAAAVAGVLGGHPVVRFAARPADGATSASTTSAPETDELGDDPLPDKDDLADASDTADPTSLLADLGAEVIEDIRYGQ